MRVHKLRVCLGASAELLTQTENILESQVKGLNFPEVKGSKRAYQSQLFFWKPGLFPFVTKKGSILSLIHI